MQFGFGRSFVTDVPAWDFGVVFDVAVSQL